MDNFVGVVPDWYAERLAADVAATCPRECAEHPTIHEPVDVLNGDSDPPPSGASEAVPPTARDVPLREAPDDEAIPRTRGIEPATNPDPARQAVVGASPHTSPATPG